MRTQSFTLWLNGARTQSRTKDPIHYPADAAGKIKTKKSQATKRLVA